MNSSPITHVIFDMDGLLLDTETLDTQATLNITQRYGKDYPLELKKKTMGRGGKEASEIIVSELDLPISPPEYIDLMNQEYDRIFREHIPLMPGAERLVRHLHSNQIPIAVCTSSRPDTYQDPEISTFKPHPQSFLVCASRFVDPPLEMDKVLVFEDSVAGVVAANAAGMKSVWVPDLKLMNKSEVEAFLILDSLERFVPQDYGLPAFVL